MFSNNAFIELIVEVSLVKIEILNMGSKASPLNILLSKPVSNRNRFRVL